MQHNQVNDILNYLNLQEQTNPSAERMEEINALLSYSRDLEKGEQSRSKTRSTLFTLSGLGLLLGSVLTLFGTVPAGPVIGVASLIFAVFYTLGTISSNPLAKLQEKMDKMHARLVKPVSRSKRRGIYKSKRDKIIAGVASGVAQRLGVSPMAIRLLFLLSIPITSGGSILLYLISAVVMSFFPSDSEGN